MGFSPASDGKIVKIVSSDSHKSAIMCPKYARAIAEHERAASDGFMLN
jgi:hypothetical protein